MIIGIVGFISSGKNTAADYLVKEFGFTQDSFAGPLKDAISTIFGWDRLMLEGLTPPARAWREQVDPWWSARLNMPNLTPRWVLQYWGTEVCRQGFADDIWIAALEARLARRKDHTVISDVRFPNEIAAIRKQGGKIVWVKRGELPDWYTVALAANNNPDLTWSREILAERGIHVSETAWVGTRFDVEIENNGTIEELYDKIKNLILVDSAAKAN